MIGRTIAQYRIEAELGRGGMGVVYRALDTRLGRPVALKFLPTDLVSDPAARARLIREARTASALNHPNICTIHDVGEAEGRTYVAMECIEGKPLEELVAKGALPLESAVRYGAQVAAALEHAHERAIIHRDLKAANILITPDGRAKVLDFGLARRAESGALDEATRSQLSHAEGGSFSGTLHYLAPEVLHGHPSDARSDLWAFGAVLYLMATGSLPFGGQTGFEVTSAILREPPALLPARVPAALRKVIERCLAKEPGQRYQRAGEVRAALEAVTLDSSRGPSSVASERAGNRTRRGLFLTAGAVVMFTVLLGIRFTDWGAALFGGRAARIESLAVLPLRSLNQQGGDPLGMGLADTIITRISRAGGMIVRPSSAVRKYETVELDALEAGRQLRVDAVLDGTLQRADDRLRVNLNLLRTRDGASLWSESFDVRLTDIFAVQDEIARQVAASLQLKLSSTEETQLARRDTSSVEAYEYFLKGMYNFDKRSLTAERKGSLEAAITMFRKAVEHDPNYALAHAQLAYSYLWMALFVEPGSHWLNQAQEEIRRTEALDPNLPLLHVVRHELLWSLYEGFRLEDSARELLQAQKLDPNVGNDQLGVLYSHMGLEDAAMRALRRAIEIDPTSEIIISRYLEGFDLLYRPDEAIARNREFGDLPGPTSYLRKSLLWKGDFERAEQIERELLRNPEDPFGLSLRGLRLALHGDFRSFDSVVPIIAEKGRTSRAFHHMTYNIACVYALQGKAPQAVEWLKKTVEFGMPNYTLFSRDPHLKAIRNDLAFVQFMNELRPRCEAWQREFGR